LTNLNGLDQTAIDVSDPTKASLSDLTRRLLTLMLAPMIRPFAYTRTTGFTLIELMVTVLIAVIVTAWAIPSFSRLVASSRLTSSTNNVILTLAQARASATSLNITTQWCGTANNVDVLGAACTAATAGGNGVGGLTLRLSNGAGVPISGSIATIGKVTISQGPQAIRFSPLGLGVDPVNPTAGPYTGTVEDLCIPGTTNNHRVISMTTGSVVSVSTTSGACP
jgi:type IV fimbrial biogenesis protein FimT